MAGEDVVFLNGCSSILAAGPQFCREMAENEEPRQFPAVRASFANATGEPKQQRE
jgi:hypothetical protein